MKRSPLVRKTAMKKSRKPIRARNVARRDPEKATAQRFAVLERDGYRCVAVSVKTKRRCLQWFPPDLQCAHVIRRHLTGSAIYDPDVAVTLCTRHHDIFDHRAPTRLWDSIVIPSEAMDRAEACVRKYEDARASAGRAVARLKKGKTA